MYTEYKSARDAAWRTLIECKIASLPLNLVDITKFYNISTISYSKSSDKTLEGDGFSTKINGRYIIYYNDINFPTVRQRFTVAHEIGHCLLGHVKENLRTYRHNSETDEYKDLKELQANVFARDILMPATVLHSLNVTSAEQIADICNVSMQSSEIRYNRLLELNKRGMFNKHPLEKQVYNNFYTYIKKALDTGTI